MENRMNTWSTIGTNVRECKNIADVLHQSKLDYTVEAETLTTDSGLIVPNRKATTALIDGERKYFGVVSDKYQICQNADAFDFVDSISDDLTFEKAGMTQSGMVYVIGRLPEVEVLGDTIQPHVIMQNSFNSRYNLRTTICPLRIVCQNQFNFAFKHSENNVTIIHSAQMVGKLANAKRLLSGVAEYMANFNEEAERLAGIQLGMSAEQIIGKFFEQSLKGDESVKKIEKIEAQKKAILNAYNCEDNQNFKGTVWGLANAYADYTTHKSTDSSDDSKFLTVTFDPHMMNKFMEFVMDRVAA